MYTAGQTSGTATFVVNTQGLYVARSFTNDTYDLVAESAVFTVCSDGAGTLCYVAKLSGAQEEPANSSTASGAALIVFKPSTGNLTYQVHHTVVGAVAGHIHQAPALTNGPVIVPFTLVGQGASGSGGADRRSGRRPGGRKPVHEHPFADVSGRRDSRPDPAARAILFVARLDGGEEVPANGSAATGKGSVIFDPATLGITYQIQHTVVSPVAGHIHQAPVGTNGPVIVPFTLVGQGASGSATLSAGAGHRSAVVRSLHEHPLGNLPGRRDPRRAGAPPCAVMR